MSFRCEECDKIVWGTMFRVVIKKREKIYTNDKIKYVKGEKTTEMRTSKDFWR